MVNKIKLTESQLKGLVTSVANKLLIQEKKFSVIDNKMFATNYGEVVGDTLPELYGNLEILMKKHGVVDYDFKIKSDGLSNVIFVDVVDTFMEDNIERLKQKYPELIFIVQKDKQGYYYIELGKRMSNGAVYRINSLKDTTGKSGIRTIEGWAEIYYKQHNLIPKSNITESILKRAIVETYHDIYNSTGDINEKLETLYKNNIATTFPGALNYYNVNKYGSYEEYYKHLLKKHREDKANDIKNKELNSLAIKQRDKIINSLKGRSFEIDYYNSDIPNKVAGTIINCGIRGGICLVYLKLNNKQTILLAKNINSINNNIWKIPSPNGSTSIKTSNELFEKMKLTNVVSESYNLTPKSNINEPILLEAYDLWNDLIKIRNKHKPGSDIYEKASMYLSQLKTAGGSDMIGREVESFIDETDTLSLEKLQQKYPQIKFTMNKKGEDRYFVRADIETQGGEMEYLGALKGFVDEKKALEFLNNTANHYYDKYY